MITDINKIEEDAYTAGFEARECDAMPTRYEDAGDNWLVWQEQWRCGEQDRLDNDLYNRDLHPDPTGQDMRRELTDFSMLTDEEMAGNW